MSKRLISILLIVLSGILFSLFDFRVIPTPIDLSFWNHSELTSIYNTVFQIQATIAVMSITLVSILASFNKEEYFGISLSKYIMFVEPRVFKYTTNIIILFTSIVISFILLISMYYNTVTYLLVLTIILCMLMAYDNLLLFKNSDKMKDKLSEYVVKSISENNDSVLEIASDAIKNEVKNNNLTKFEYSISRFNSAYFEALEGNKDKIEKMNVIYQDIIISLLNKNQYGY